MGPIGRVAIITLSYLLRNFTTPTTQTFRRLIVWVDGGGAVAVVGRILPLKFFKCLKMSHEKKLF